MQHILLSSPLLSHLSHDYLIDRKITLKKYLVQEPMDINNLAVHDTMWLQNTLIVQTQPKYHLAQGMDL